jgi:hypothetical protein
MLTLSEHGHSLAMALICCSEFQAEVAPTSVRVVAVLIASRIREAKLGCLALITTVAIQTVRLTDSPLTAALILNEQITEISGPGVIESLRDLGSHSASPWGITLNELYDDMVGPHVCKHLK